MISSQFTANDTYISSFAAKGLRPYLNRMIVKPLSQLVTMPQCLDILKDTYKQSSSSNLIIIISNAHKSHNIHILLHNALLDTFHLYTKLYGHEDKIEDIIEDPLRPNVILSASADGIIYEWDIFSGIGCQFKMQPSMDICSIAINNAYLVVTGDKDIRIFTRQQLDQRVEGSVCVLQRNNCIAWDNTMHNSYILQSHFHPLCNNLLITADDLGFFNMWMLPQQSTSTYDLCEQWHGSMQVDYTVSRFYIYVVNNITMIVCLSSYQCIVSIFMYDIDNDNSDMPLYTYNIRDVIHQYISTSLHCTIDDIMVDYDHDNMDNDNNDTTTNTQQQRQQHTSNTINYIQQQSSDMSSSLSTSSSTDTLPNHTIDEYSLNILDNIHHNEMLSSNNNNNTTKIPQTLTSSLNLLHQNATYAVQPAMWKVTDVLHCQLLPNWDTPSTPSTPSGGQGAPPKLYIPVTTVGGGIIQCVLSLHPTIQVDNMILISPPGIQCSEPLCDCICLPSQSGNYADDTIILTSGQESTVSLFVPTQRYTSLQQQHGHAGHHKKHNDSDMILQPRRSGHHTGHGKQIFDLHASGSSPSSHQGNKSSNASGGDSSMKKRSGHTRQNKPQQQRLP